MPKNAPKKAPAKAKAKAAAPSAAAASAAAAPAPITRDRMLKLLNADLAREFQALVQYVQHAAVITGPQYDAISAELLIHATEEHTHAVSLAQQIDFLGGTPGVDVAKAHMSPDSKAMLEQDLEGELDAIARYKERVGQAERLQEYGLRRALEDILIVEEEHARDLQNALDL